MTLELSKWYTFGVGRIHEARFVKLGPLMLATYLWVDGRRRYELHVMMKRLICIPSL